MADDLVPRDELRATLAARRELGEEYDDALVDRLAEQLEARLAPAQPPAKITPEQRTALTVIALLASVPLLAIASGSGVPGVALVCLALVGVVYVIWR